MKPYAKSSNEIKKRLNSMNRERTRRVARIFNGTRWILRTDSLRNFFFL